MHLDVDTVEREPGCGLGPRRWGFPTDGGIPNVTAIIATVPDPVHGHLAQNFDRAVDSILQAAADSNYVSSYYWLPWRAGTGGLKLTEREGDAEPGHDSKRERQPGLIILKHVPFVGDPQDPSESFYKVVYLFLVAETPTEGVDGFQLQNAFSYEAELQSAHGIQFSSGRDGVAIVGPVYSGSAASLRAGIETAQRKLGLAAAVFRVSGETTTRIAANQLATARIDYLSFDNDRDYSTTAFERFLPASGRGPGGVAFLVEDNTALGSSASEEPVGVHTLPTMPSRRVIRFPRDISLLRNAQSASSQAENGAAPLGSIPSPYLHLSLKDSSRQDSVPQFSAEHTPLSQEAQLMAIARRIHQLRSRYVAVVGSSVLDQLFLAQFLHRACPSATLVFFGSDLLMVRELESVPFIGSVSITPYPLMTLQGAERSYPNSSNEAVYNAAAYTFWRAGLGARLTLDGYPPPLKPEVPRRPELWALAIGRDGYYPLGILSRDASARLGFLPPQVVRPRNQGGITIYPSLPWAALCALVSLLCLLHALTLLAADYWSPFTRDLAIRDNDQPRRRSMYVHVATAMLFSMAFVVSWPVVALWCKYGVDGASKALSVTALACGAGAVLAALRKTWGHNGWQRAVPRKGHAPIERAYEPLRTNVYLWFNLLAWATLVVVPGLWWYLCFTDQAGWQSPGRDLHFVGLCFSYRSIHPGSGVSPVVPVLLLLFSWFLWGAFQTRRLRFSENGRPWLPGKLKESADNGLFVSDEELADCGSPRHCCLYKNVMCLLITREALRRFWWFRARPQKAGGTAGPGGRGPRPESARIDLVLVCVYAGLLIWFSCLIPFRSLDHFLWNVGPHSPYEFLVGLLFFPLLVVCLTGWLRMILIWGALKRGLLERLENLPIRFAFSRLRAIGWMKVLRDAGLHDQWRDMARCVESMRQMLHQPDLAGSLSDAELSELAAANAGVLKAIGRLRKRRDEVADPHPGQERDYELMRQIELGFAAFSQSLLSILLIPYWRDERTGLVESEEVEELPVKARRSPAHAGQPFVPMELHAGPAEPTPARVLVAEEFVAIRYMSLIRAVLANLRHLMVFVSVSFVLAIVAWNSYPFQPRQEVELLFTGVLLLLGVGVVWVLAQMHRNSILSRITETRANELGLDFYVRVISLGGVPVLAWLAYQFPDIGGVILRVLQPGVPVVK